MQDRIEKQVVLKAPRSRVWRAISDKTEFGTWFQCRFPPGAFQAGEKAHAKMTYPGYEHMGLDIEVVEVEPETRLSYRWHPGMPKPGEDHSKEPMTLVTFTLADADGGTLLTIVESGFDQLSAERRASAYKDNEGGWTSQVRNIEKHVSTR
jgi:uncharacterized protein YndB with AHSA1/START domain